MSALSDSPTVLVARARQSATDALVDVCWQQWGRLGFMTGDVRSGAGDAFIDPEALLLMTLDAVRAEPRLDAALSWWAVVGADLMSIPRLSAIRASVPGDLDGPIVGFAACAVGAGATSTAWKRLARGERVPPPERLKGVSDTGTGLTLVERPALTRPEAAMLRVRALAGVGAKADVIAFLAATSDRSSSAKTLQKALGYSYVPLRRAADDLVAAGIACAEAPAGRGAVRYAFQPGVLDLGNVPPWRYWPQIAAFLLHTARWGGGLPPGASAYALASRARDLAGLFEAFWAEHPLPARYPVAAPRDHPGEAYLEPFAQTVEAVARWIADGLPVGPAAPSGLVASILDEL